MDFIFNEADTETDSLKFDSDEDQMECDDSTPLSEGQEFLDDNTCYEEDIEHGPSFYRTFNNREEFSTFENQIKNPVESSERSEKNCYGEDDLPELFAPENRKTVNFHSFTNDEKRALDFKKNLQCFVLERENQFFLCSKIWFNVPKNKRCYFHNKICYFTTCVSKINSLFYFTIKLTKNLVKKFTR